MPGFEQNTNQPSGSFGGGQDFSGSLNDILAPYRQMAQQFQSPYATMRPNSWLAQNHPQVAGVLDNAFLTMGMTPQAQGPEGAGGGIARTMQGLIGAQQFRRQQMMQNAMLPMQMAGPTLSAMDTLSQIHERNAMIPFRQSQERRYDAQSEMYYNRMAQGDRQKALAGPDLTDDKGGTWSRVFDPISGATRLYNPVLQKHADELPDGQQPTFDKEHRQQRMSTPGGLAGEIIDMRMSADPAVKARGLQMADMYSQMQGAAAGARVAGEQNAPHPYTDTKTFTAEERTAAYGQLPKTLSASDYQTSRITDPDYWKNPQKEYQNYIKGNQSAKQQLDLDLGKYEKSGAPAKGVSYQEYLQNRELWDGSAPNPAPSNPVGPATGSNWTPK